MAPKRAPPRRPPAKEPMASIKQMHYLSQQQAQMTRMFQQQARDRRAYIVRSISMFSLLVLVTSYTYKSYGLVVSVAVVMAGWMMGFLEVVQIAFTWIVRNAAQPSYDELLRRADILSQPVKTKDTVSGENEFLAYGCSSMQGWRRTMEDAHTLLMMDNGGFFGVYDGHSGSATSKYCGEYMFQFVHQTAAFTRGEISQALYDGFIAIDKYLHSLPNFERGGCAAVVLYVDGDNLYCANAGDSRCIMCRNGSVDALSTDHKPFLPAEQMRIERAGCYVLNRRVNGMLALSRAIGDFMFKNNTQVSWEMQAVTCAPEVRVAHLNRDKDEFAVLACDGIWDMMTSEQVVEFVRPRIQQRVPLGRICEELMDACLSPQPFGLGCDNMSVIIVTFKRGSQGAQSPGASTGNASAAPQPTVILPNASGSADGSSNSNSNNTNNSKTTVVLGGDGLNEHTDTTCTVDSNVGQYRDSSGLDAPQNDAALEGSRLLRGQSRSPSAHSPSLESLPTTQVVAVTSHETVVSVNNMHNAAVLRQGGSECKDGFFSGAGSGNVPRTPAALPSRVGTKSINGQSEHSAR
ncbi:protein phosphatase 2C [Lotmaria passim]